MVRITSKKKSVELYRKCKCTLFLMPCILFSTVNLYLRSDHDYQKFLNNKQREIVNAENIGTSSTTDVNKNHSEEKIILQLKEENTVSNLETSTTTKKEQQDETEITNERYGLSKDLIRRTADNLWNILIRKGRDLNSQTEQSSSPMISMEVGMHRLRQCLHAAENNFTVHCIEPSPTSYQTISEKYRSQKKIDPDAAKRISLYNVAAGNTTGTTIPFTSVGSTGDHIGDFDTWTMKARPENTADVSSRTTIDVPMVTLDDIIANKIIPTDSYYNNNDNDDTKQTNNDKIDEIYSLKVDTQGFEPSVFSGLTSSIEQHKIQYILFEYWPKGMDLLSHSNLETKCEASTAILVQLAKAGYTLYPLRVAAHPSRPNEARKYIKAQEGRPYDDFKSFCMWYYKIEELAPSEDYRMGYWTDILAISPEVTELDEKLQLLSGRKIEKNEMLKKNE